MSQTLEMLNLAERTASDEFAGAETSALRQIEHQLRQPLSTIEAIAYYLSITLPPHETRALEHLERLQELVQDADAILASAVHFLSDEPPNAVRLDLNEVVANALSQTVKPDAQPVRVATSDRPVLVRIDPAQGALMVRNFCACFRGIAAPMSPVEVAVSAGQGDAELSILVESSLASAAEVGSLLDPVRPRLGSRCGLAMASARRIVDAHGGAVTVAEQPPRGIRLVISIPLAG